MFSWALGKLRLRTEESIDFESHCFCFIFNSLETDFIKENLKKKKSIDLVTFYELI